MDDRLDRSSSSTSGIGRSASKSTNSARSSTNSFSDTDLEYGATLTERSLAKTNQENGVILKQQSDARDMRPIPSVDFFVFQLANVIARHLIGCRAKNSKKFFNN